MNTRVVVGLLAAGVLFGTSAVADCAYPKAPASLPDGKTATQDEMVVGMTAIKKYQGDVDTYLKCLDTEAEKGIAAVGTADGAAEKTKQIDKLRTDRHNAAVDELQSQAGRFNEQVKAFKERQKKS